VDPKKIESMQFWPCPKTLKILCGFLGLIGYYRKFVHNYGKIAAPLTSLLKMNAFTWSSIVDQAFQAFKDAMCSIPILEFPNFTKTFILECDASELNGIRVIIFFVAWPILWAGNATNKAMDSNETYN
jgi:hypothetical protein